MFIGKELLGLFPTLLPLLTLLHVKRSDAPSPVSITRDTWNKEYNYIIGKLYKYWFKIDFLILIDFPSDKTRRISRNLRTWWWSVGAGSAGAVLAARLSENPSVNVLLLEAGGSENIISDIPLAYQSLQNTPMDWAYRTVPQEASCFGLKDKVCDCSSS